MIELSSRLGRQQGLTLGVWWLLAVAGPGALWALLVYFHTRYDLDALTETFNYALLVGVLVGILQSLVLRRCLYTRTWWMWGLFSWAGWVIALVFLIAGLIFSLGIMMHDVGFEQSFNLQCIWIFACGMAGVSVGSFQTPFLRRFSSGIDMEWIVINALGWAIGGLIGRVVGIVVYAFITGSTSVDDVPPAESFSFAIGIAVAALIVGAITGGGMVSIVHGITRVGSPVQTQ